jgi:hypothetical protein
MHRTTGAEVPSRQGPFPIQPPGIDPDRFRRVTQMVLEAGAEAGFIGSRLLPGGAIALLRHRG